MPWGSGKAYEDGEGVVLSSKLFVVNICVSMWSMDPCFAPLTPNTEMGEHQSVTLSPTNQYHPKEKLKTRPQAVGVVLRHCEWDMNNLEIKAVQYLDGANISQAFFYELEEVWRKYASC